MGLTGVGAEVVVGVGVVAFLTQLLSVMVALIALILASPSLSMTSSFLISVVEAASAFFAIEAFFRSATSFFLHSF